MYRMGQEEKDAVARVIDCGKLFKVNDGPLQEVRNFDKELQEKMGVKYSILMTSGQGALVSALVGMGIGPGDEVIVPAYTYIATAMAVVAAGAVPVIAEIDETMTLDPEDVEKKITARTKAIIPVHMLGLPCDMDRIMAVAKKHDLLVLEDACQADGGSYKGKRLGTIGDAGALSFNFAKIISAGEGGALMTDNKELFERAYIYHDSSAVAYFGKQMDDFTAHPFCGTEIRTNEITAAILRVQLGRLDGILHDLRTNKKKLTDLLKSHFKFIPSNDPEGDCGTTLALWFDEIEDAAYFEEHCPIKAKRPINTNRHVYTNWSAILEKKGPALNPFDLPENSFASYDKDCCLRSLDYLKKMVYLQINPDWTDEEIEGIAKQLIAVKD